MTTENNSIRMARAQRILHPPGHPQPQWPAPESGPVAPAAAAVPLHLVVQNATRTSGLREEDFERYPANALALILETEARIMSSLVHVSERIDSLEGRLRDGEAGALRANNELALNAAEAVQSLHSAHQGVAADINTLLTRAAELATVARGLDERIAESNAYLARLDLAVLDEKSGLVPRLRRLLLGYTTAEGKRIPSAVASILWDATEESRRSLASATTDAAASFRSDVGEALKPVRASASGLSKAARDAREVLGEKQSNAWLTGFWCSALIVAGVLLTLFAQLFVQRLH